MSSKIRYYQPHKVWISALFVAFLLLIGIPGIEQIQAQTSSIEELYLNDPDNHNFALVQPHELEVYFLQGIGPRDVLIQTDSSKVDKVSSDYYEEMTPLAIPSGFNLIRSDLGVALYKKDYSGGQPDFVQVAKLDNGASVKLLHGSIADMQAGQGPYGGNNATFWKTSLAAAWEGFAANNNRAFCVSNGQFFSTAADPTPLAFPLKKDGQILSDGYGSTSEFPGQLLILEIWNDHANIRALTRDNLYGSSAPDILGGLSEYANKSSTSYVGRTFAGVDDTDGNGQYETIYIYNSKYARQIDAATTLRKFGADKVIMFDGGGSTQLRCGSDSYISSTRPIPQTIGVVAASENQPVCPTVSGLVRLFDDPNCGGASTYANEPGLWSMAQSFNDRTESIAIPSGWSARLFLHDSESGPSQCFRSTDADLWDDLFSDYSVVANAATWMRVFDNGDCALTLENIIFLPYVDR